MSGTAGETTTLRGESLLSELSYLAQVNSDVERLLTAANHELSEFSAFVQHNPTVITLDGIAATHQKFTEAEALKRPLAEKRDLISDMWLGQVVGVRLLDISTGALVAYRYPFSDFVPTPEEQDNGMDGKLPDYYEQEDIAEGTIKGVFLDGSLRIDTVRRKLWIPFYYVHKVRPFNDQGEPVVAIEVL